MNINKFILYCFIFLLEFMSGVSQAKSLNLDGVTFSPTVFNVGAGQPAMTVCDCTSDGHMDVIVANYSDNNIVLYEGDGKGGLVKSGSYSAGENPTGIAVADINADGAIDVAIANHETPYVTLLLNDGKGGFKKAPHSPLRIGLKPHPHAVKLRDIDGDGIAELIVDSRDNEALLVSKGLGSGNFKKSGHIIAVGGDPYRGFAVGDINGDGALDLITPNQNDIGIMVNSGTDEATFSLTKLAQSAPPFGVELADLTSDGKLDLVVVTHGAVLTVYPGNGRGSFEASNKTTFNVTSGAKQIALGDINGDGIQDALISNWSGELHVIFGSKGTLHSATFEHANIRNPWGVALTDLNHDGKSDLIIADGDSDAAVVYVSQKE